MKFLQKNNMKKLTSIGGAILMIIAVVFIVERFRVMWDEIDFSVLTHFWIIMALVMVALFEAIWMMLNAINYRKLVKNVSGVKVDYPLAIKVYNIANLYKYIPGGVMYFIGRNQMVGPTKSLTHGKVALATVLEGILWGIVGATISFIYAFNYSVNYFHKLEIMPLAQTIFVIVLIIIILLIFLFRKKLKKAIDNLKGHIKDFSFVIFKRITWTFVLMNLWSTTFLATLIIMGAEVNFSLAITVMGLYTLSWTIGFLTPGVPSGIGVREAMMLMFLSAAIDQSILLGAIVMHRGLQVVGDVIAYGMGMLYFKIRGKK